MKMRIPTNKEYDKLVDLTGGDDEKMHWNNMASHVTDTENQHGLPDVYWAYRGCYSARCWGSGSVLLRGSSLGFRPVVVLNPGSLPPDIKEGMSMVIGTLYMNGAPVHVPENPVWNGDIETFIFDSSLEMREALDDSQYQITGIYIGNGVVVADRVILKNISYNDILETIGVPDDTAIACLSKTGCVRVDTPIGAIFVSAKGDEEYPGVFIDLRRPNFDNDLLLDMVEFHPDEKNIVTHVYGNGMEDEPTDRIVHTGIEDFFALTDDKNEETDKRTKAEQCLIDNGIDPEEASTVLQALGYILMDKELYPTKNGDDKK